MPKLMHTISAPYSIEQLFNLVADIGAYPEFLPYCEAARIKQKTDNIVIAELAIKYQIFRGCYTSKVTLLPHEEIIVELVEGPFKHLSNNWKFMPHEDGAEVIFTLDFALKSKIIESIISSEFENYSNKLMTAFLKRAALVC